MSGHLYVTRAATLEYQKHTRDGFETARRDLTERLLAELYIRENGAARRVICFYVEPRTSHHLALHFRATLQPDGAFLIVPKLERL